VTLPPPDEDVVPLGPRTEETVAEIRFKLQRAVRRICPRWLADRSEDLVQVAVMRVLEACPPGEGKAPLAASYLYKVAYTTLIDEIRRLRRRPETQLEDAGAPTASEPAPDQALAGLEAGRAIEACLGNLVEPRRLAVTLYLQGHTVPQAARLLGWSPKRTENLVYRGLADLRSCLHDKGVTP
jgi:RNA polymerase sigma-70 factor (ECF subfamily)